MSDIDITARLERLDLFEERAGVRLEAISVFHEREINFVSVRGELHPRDDARLRHSVQLEIAIYDNDGRVVGTSGQSFRKEELFGFHTFDIPIASPVDTISKVRLIPRIDPLDQEEGEDFDGDTNG